MTPQIPMILSLHQLETRSTQNTLKANLLMYSTFSLSPHKKYIQSYLNQLTPMLSAWLPCEPLDQQDLQALTLTNGDSCAPLLKVHP